MMDKDLDLDALFAEAAEVQVALSPELSARILADAARLQLRPQPFAKPAVSVPVRKSALGWLVGVGEVLGGVRSLAGLSLAGLTGLYLGMAQPAAVQSVTALLAGATTTTVDQLDLLPSTGTLWTGE